MKERFAKALRQALINRSWKPERLAVEVGCSASTVYKWLAGDTFPSPTFWSRIKATLGLDPYEFFERTIKEGENDGDRK